MGVKGLSSTDISEKSRHATNVVYLADVLTSKKSEEEHKIAILKAAAALIKNDIRSMPANKQFYPSTDAILSTGDSVPPSIVNFLRNIFSKKDSDLIGFKGGINLCSKLNAVTHMLSGKAVSRSVRGFMLVDIALHWLITEDMFETNETNEEAEPTELTQYNSNLTEARQLLYTLLNKQVPVETAVNHDALKVVEKESKRTGDWELHLTSIQEMLPHLAAAGHYLYTKSALIRLTQMLNLKTKHPDVYAHFMCGHHVIRRSDRLLAGLSTDLIIEQVLMRSIKSTGGLTRRRGMGEAQRTQWLLAMPVCAEYNNVMQQVTGAGHKSSNQHVESKRTRKEKDQKDIVTLHEFLKERSPFTEDKSLRSIETSMVANDEANFDNAREIGHKILIYMTEQLVLNFHLKRKARPFHWMPKEILTPTLYRHHKVPWTKDQTFSQICTKYVDHVKRKFSSPTVVFDGYDNHSTKDITHMRRSKGIVSNIVTFKKDMPLRVKKETFLGNDANKQRFITLLQETFIESGIDALQAQDDADLLIVQTAVTKSHAKEVVVFGEDTDLLVLLCHHAKQNQNKIYFTSDKQAITKAHKKWDISKTKSVIGEELCNQSPFFHAMTGCDTTRSCLE
ncbi:unnamed protein product [Mytilus coruscus]|uniref:NYN domain-containing protein n=1 Tax=Mytilus coruscus TaxID=42192 RepID=A0A6J8CEC6_MYTCO|nr:unnamed protein product [Mytilus coruscus]